MSEYVVANGERRGTVTVRPSKSELHRRLVCAALCPAPTRMDLRGFPLNSDNRYTLQGLQDLGLLERLDADGPQLVLRGRRPVLQELCRVDCGESGTTLRFLIPLALLFAQPCRFTGKGRLFERPLEPFLQLFRAQGALCRPENGSLTVSGQLRAGDFVLPPHISSQFASALLLSLPLCSVPSRLLFSAPPSSKAYIDLTLKVLRGCGVKTAWNGPCCLEIPGGQHYLPNQAPLAGDYSQAAFYLAAGALSGPVTVDGLISDSVQADEAIMQLLADYGARVERRGRQVTVSRGVCRPLRVDVDQMPDLAPVLAVLATAANGVSVLSGARRLRYKESDRLQGLVSCLGALGADIGIQGDELHICGRSQLEGGRSDPCGDHRLAMALAVSASVCRQPVLIPDSAVMDKSAPEFREQYESLQAKGGDHADLG